MLDAFKLTAILISGILWGAWLVLMLRKKDVHPLRETLEGFSRLGWLKKVGVLFIVVQLTMFGGAKHGGTNDVDVGEATSPSLLMVGTRPFKSGEDTASPFSVAPFSAPYRLESVSTNEGYSYAMPADGTLRGTWHLTGAYEDVQKVTLDGFAFPLGSDLCTSLWVYTWGKVRPQLKNASNEIAAVGAPMSAIPDVSRFWTAATSNDTYLLTWEDFALGRIAAPTNASSLIPDPSSLVSAQLELKRNGDFIMRSNDVESVWRRVVEPNPIVYPVNPPDPDDPSKPLYPYGPVQDLSVIEETNAYCRVDIVVDNADAWVQFEGDGASNLADPSFAAKAGETNHVVILIGKTYKVTCDMPFTVVGKSDPSIDEWWEDSNTLWLNWPVNIWSIGDDEEPPLLLMSFGSGSHHGNGFAMFVSPFGLGGEFSWTNSCCAVSGIGLHFSYGCDGFCLCGGCSARGYYGYEGYRIGCSGGSCGCSWYDDDDRHGEDDPDDPEPTPSISVSFDDAAVIFEDEYANMPGEVVPHRSTTTKLHLEAHGGMKGGTATFTFTNQEKLIGPDIPESISIPAGHCKKYEFTYRGLLPSGSTNDIVVTGTFTENDPEGEGGAATYTDEDSTTSVKVELTPLHIAPGNPCRYRHVVGVNEYVNTQLWPSGVAFSWQDDDIDVQPEGGLSFYCPWHGGTYWPKANVCGVEYQTVINVEEPHVICRYAVWDGNWGAYGIAGNVGMNLALFVEPSYVSFEGLYMAEIPDDTPRQHWGYFDDTSKGGPWSHTAAAGAGHWSAVGSGGYWTMDAAGVRQYVSPWSDGGKVWEMPVGWGNPGVERGRISPNPTQQEFSITASGTVTVRKYSHEVYRTVMCGVFMDGVCVHEEEYHE